jgi:hypothetical protein
MSDVKTTRRTELKLSMSLYRRIETNICTAHRLVHPAPLRTKAEFLNNEWTTQV